MVIQTKVRKIGTGLGILIPKKKLEEIGAGEGAIVIVRRIETPVKDIRGILRGSGLKFERQTEDRDLNVRRQ